ncbi:hypothetical protein RIF29_25009 [Crotalaria pallida]|uniref:Uncharacterized protein n=1 Tax=Crotalaria pallida TaxID=3830 RepID=A0AAN9HYX5_CROPI
MTEPSEKHVEFGVGGICNSCTDPANAAIVTECGGIPLIIQCLSSPVRNTKLDNGNGPSIAFVCSSEAALAGAESTKHMQAQVTT